MKSKTQPFLREVKPGREALAPRLAMPRHRHIEAYALIVVAGALEQVSYAGRVRLRDGDMLVQPTLDCHSNYTSGAQVLRLSWPAVANLGGVYRLDDLDAVVRAAERDTDEASALVQAAVTRQSACGRSLNDWPDMLACDLAAGRVERLGTWAETNGLEPETLSRGFAKAYGIAPAQFGLELKTRTAWLKITGTSEALADIAADTGFADQAHMTRSVRAMMGAPPGAWRAPI